MSYASYALRFAVGFDGMMMVLSGMSDMNQMKDNLSSVSYTHSDAADELIGV